jgi:hydrogenase nickel incorporation protein HypB
MCAECGCSDADHHVKAADALNGVHSHAHEHPHPHDVHTAHDPHAHRSNRGMTLKVDKRILSRNDEHAAINRHWLSSREILALNLLSSPGAGKTTLLERTVQDLAGETRLSVIEGDQETDADARRIRAAGGHVVQINTGQGCHLDAQTVHHALHELNPPSGSLLIIENVGNLICPALFDLGEQAKAVISSVTEGEDKPLKYPYVFRATNLVLLNKIDLLPYVSFDMQRFLHQIQRVNPRARVLPISATRGDGLADWYAWVRQQHSHGAR